MDTQNFIEIAQPYIVSIVVAVIGTLAAVILAGLKTVKEKAVKWLDAKTTESQRTTLRAIGREAFAHAEALFKDSGGEQKLREAEYYADKRIKELGLGFGFSEIKAAIHEAVVDHNAKAKTQTVVQVPNATDVTIEQSKVPGRS